MSESRDIKALFELLTHADVNSDEVFIITSPAVAKELGAGWELTDDGFSFEGFERDEGDIE